MDFDITTGIICVLIALTSGLVIFAISKFTMRGYSSYDDVKASRRLDKIRPANNDRPAEAKKLKKIKKKLKKENMHSAGLMHSADEVAVEEEIIPTESTNEAASYMLIPPKIEEKPVLHPKVKNKKGTKKLDGPVIIEAIPKKVSDNASNSKNDIDSSPKNEPKYNTDSVNLVENDVSNNSVDEEGPVNSDSNGKMKKKIKKKKGDINEDSGKLTLQTILPLLKQAEFSHGEVQILIDALLNKDDSEWLKGKQDPMLKLKKQVMEMEKLHADDTETINGLQVKLASLRSELNSEKSNSKTLKEAIAKANSDIHSVSTKFQQLTEEKETLFMSVQQLKQQLAEEQRMVHKLQEEKLLYSQMKISHEQHHEAVVALQSQINQLATQLTDEQTLNVNLAAQLDDSMRFEEEYRQVNALNAELNHHLSNSQFEVNRLNSELVSLSKQLDDSRAQISDLSEMIEAFETQKNELLSENEDLKIQIAKANQDARTFQKMADALEHNLEENKNNGNINFHNDHSECQSVLDETKQEIANLNLELNKKESVIEKLTGDVINCKNEANKKQTVIENLNVELTALKALGAKISSELNDEKNICTTLRSTLTEKSEVVNRLTNEVDSYKHRNNELRSKNWKVVEALEKAEASLKDLALKSSNSSVTGDSRVAAIKCRINRLMQSLVSSSNPVSLYNIEDNDLWLDKVEEIMNNANKEPKSENMLAQNTKLQNLVTHYRSVIYDLEKMLFELELRIESLNQSQKSVTHPETDLDD